MLGKFSAGSYAKGLAARVTPARDSRACLTGNAGRLGTRRITGKLRLAGDYNGDNVVDASDYLVWRNKFGQFVTAYSSADGDGNSTIDNADLDVWRAHFGQTASAGGASLGGASVPEPATLFLALFGLLPTCKGRARRT